MRPMSVANAALPTCGELTLEDNGLMRMRGSRSGSERGAGRSFMGGGDSTAGGTTLDEAAAVPGEARDRRARVD
jgi:hypothetical protein